MEAKELCKGRLFFHFSTRDPVFLLFSSIGPCECRVHAKRSGVPLSSAPCGAVRRKDVAAGEGASSAVDVFSISLISSSFADVWSGGPLGNAAPDSPRSSISKFDLKFDLIPIVLWSAFLFFLSYLQISSHFSHHRIARSSRLRPSVVPFCFCFVFSPFFTNFHPFFLHPPSVPFALPSALCFSPFFLGRERCDPSRFPVSPLPRPHTLRFSFFFSCAFQTQRCRVLCAHSPLFPARCVPLHRRPSPWPTAHSNRDFTTFLEAMGRNMHFGKKGRKSAN